MLIALTSWKGSPGVTTATLALATTWPAGRQVVAAEMDPLGGEALIGYGQGSRVEGSGALEMVLSARGSGLPLRRAIGEHVVALDDTRNRWLLPGVTRPQEAAAVPWGRLGDEFARRRDVTMLADCGRLMSQGAPVGVLRGADLTVLMMGASTTAVYAVHRSDQVLLGALGVAERATGSLVAVVVGARRDDHSTNEIARHLSPLGIPVLGELAFDPTAAAVFSTGAVARRSFSNSRLLRSAADLADALHQRAIENCARPAPDPGVFGEGTLTREVAW